MDEKSIKKIIHEELQPVCKKLDRFNVFAYGPEGEPEKGMMVRMDRVERVIKAVVWALALFVTALAMVGAGKLLGA